MIKVKGFTDKIGENYNFEKLAADAANEWLAYKGAQYQPIDIKYNTIYDKRLGSMFASILIVYDDNIVSPNTPNEDNIESRLGGCEKDILHRNI